jgi:hypothetical protein
MLQEPNGIRFVDYDTFTKDRRFGFGKPARFRIDVHGM